MTSSPTAHTRTRLRGAGRARRVVRQCRPCRPRRLRLAVHPQAPCDTRSDMAAAPLPNEDYSAPSTKRVSYILPPVQYAPRLFRLPSLEENAVSSRGRSGPLLLAADHNANNTPIKSQSNRAAYLSHPATAGQGTSNNPHPRHTLPVSSLAIDLSTVLQDSPERRPTGILYTGGRDGMIGAWELGLRLKRRRTSRHFDAAGDDDEDMRESATGLLDDEHLQARGEEWVVDEEGEGEGEEGQRMAPAAKFRQCIGSHTDWINDILLCNQNQTGELSSTLFPSKADSG